LVRLERLHLVSTKGGFGSIAPVGRTAGTGHNHPVNQAAILATRSCAWIGVKRDLLDDALVPFNADLNQNSDPEVEQRGRHLDA
jgi:hypothetical protein